MSSWHMSCKDMGEGRDIKGREDMSSGMLALYEAVLSSSPAIGLHCYKTLDATSLSLQHLQEPIGPHLHDSHSSTFLAFLRWSLAAFWPVAADSRMSAASKGFHRT